MFWKRRPREQRIPVTVVSWDQTYGYKVKCANGLLQDVPLVMLHIPKRRGKSGDSIESVEEASSKSFESFKKKCKSRLEIHTLFLTVENSFIRMK